MAQFSGPGGGPQSLASILSLLRDQRITAQQAQQMALLFYTAQGSANPSQAASSFIQSVIGPASGQLAGQISTTIDPQVSEPLRDTGAIPGTNPDGTIRIAPTPTPAEVIVSGGGGGGGAGLLGEQNIGGRNALTSEGGVAAGVDDVSQLERLLEIGATSAGRAQQFASTLAAGPEFQNSTSFVRRIAQRRFAAANAAFLANLGLSSESGGQLGSFREFLLQQGGGQGFDFNKAFGQLGQAFGEQGGEFAQQTRQFLNEPNVAKDLIFQSALQGVNPALRRAFTTVTGDRINAFLDPDPGANLFSEFVNRGFRF